MQNNKVRFTAIGDVGVDIYREEKKELPGGTALNSAIFASQEGASAAAISAVGKDKLSKIPLEALVKYKVDTTHLEILEGETDKVDIELDKVGRPEYFNWKLGVLERFRLNQEHENFLQLQHVAIGVHLPEIKALFDSFAKMKLEKTVKVADFTDLSEYNGNVEIIKEYVHNFDVLALSIDASEKDRLASFYDIADEHNKMAIALMGKDGSAVYLNGNLFYQEAIKTNVIDTTGAGDAYLAVFFVQYLQTQDISFSMQKAALKASTVIQHIGAIAE